MSEGNKGTMSKENVDKAIASLSAGVDNVDAVAVFVVGTDDETGANCIGGGLAGKFSVKQLEGIHLSFMRSTVKALTQMTGMDARTTEMMLTLAIVEAAERGEYSSQEGMQDRSLELAEHLGADGASKDATAAILRGIMGDAGSKLN